MVKSRVGYRLTEDALWSIHKHDTESCHCRTSPPPCSWCVDTCSAEDAEDIDEYWEIDPDYEEEEMTEPYLFKKGDIVERINTNAYECIVGKEYTVSKDQTKSTWDRLHIINDIGEDDFWNATNFKLIKKVDKGNAPQPAPYEFKVGDKVRAKDQESLDTLSRFSSDFSLTSIHYIRRIFDNKNLEIICGEGSWQTWNPKYFQLTRKIKRRIMDIH